MGLYEFDRILSQEVSGTIIGTDEAGRGPLAGPVVAAAVILDLANPIDGIDDSKKISPSKREKLYDIVTEQSIAWAVSIVDAQEIDTLNILQASLTAMKRAVDSITKPWSLLLVDGNKMVGEIPTEKQRTIVKGDSKSASIAAASIVAKVTRDRIMEEYHTSFPLYEFGKHKGYPTQKHRELVALHGLCPIHRKSFCEKFILQTELPL